MPSAITGSTSVVFYLVLFASVGLVFVFVNLLIGRFLRPRDPHPEKLEIYECGEPSIGSSFVQFDLRFYVVALIFIIFDVEVAFLFPWATVYGKAHHLTQPGVAEERIIDTGAGESAAQGVLRELGVESGPLDADVVHEGGRQLLEFATGGVLVFFVVLLVGFAYEWKTGALDWVRSITDEFKERSSHRARRNRGSPEESVLSA